MGDIKERLERLESPLTLLAWGVSAISGSRLGLDWKLRTLDKPFGFLVLKPSAVRFAEVSFLNIWLELRSGLDVHGLYIAGVVANRAQWRFGILTGVGLQMAINLNSS